MDTAARDVHTGDRSVQRWTVGRAARVVTLLAAAFVFVYFIVTFILAAFKSNEELVNRSGGFLGIGSLSWDNVRFTWEQLRDFNDGVFFRWLRNSVILAAGGSVLSLIAGMPAGYAMARLRFRARRTLLFITMLTMVMPNTVLVIPIFLEVSAIGQVNKLWPVIVIMAFYPFGVFLAFIHFSTAMPYELVEAARVDGLSEVGIFTRIALPISKQAAALVVFFSFVANWTNYYLPLVLLPVTKNAPLSVGLQQLVSSSQLYDPSTAAGLNVDLFMPQLAFAALITMLPILGLFLAAQRYLVAGQTLGAVKG